MVSKYALIKFFNSSVVDFEQQQRQILEHAVQFENPEHGFDLSGYCFKTKPRLYQLSAFLIGLSQNSFLFYYDMGLGKTKICLDLINFRRQKKEINRALFVAAGPDAVYDITEQVSVHTDLQPLALTNEGTTEEKWEKLNNIDRTVDVVIVNYQSLIWLLCDLQYDRKTKKKKQTLNFQKIKKFNKLFQFLVLDEIFMCQNHRSITYGVCRQLAEKMKYVYGLTGTPVGRDPHSLWTQFYLVDRGKTLGPNITSFRQFYFTAKKNFWGGYEHKFKKDKLEHLSRRLKNKSVQCTIEEAGEDLPAVTRKIVRISVCGKVKALYREVIDGAVSDQLQGLQLTNCFMKVRQLSSSFMFYDDEDERNIITFDNAPKLDACIELIEQVSNDKKIIVFYEFTHSGDLLSKALKKKKIRCLRLSGEKKEKNVVQKFKTGGYKVLVVQNKAGATSLNLQCANYILFYESTLSSVERKQQEARVYRIGQKQPVFFFDFVTDLRCDERIQEWLKEGKEFSVGLFSKNLKYL